MVLLGDFPFVMFTGVIYLRISPSGKWYIGQAVDIDSRDRDFLRVNHPYGGVPIENARRKYPPTQWRKLILATVNAEDRIDLRIWLDALEVYSILMHKTLCFVLFLSVLFLYLHHEIIRIRASFRVESSSCMGAVSSW